MQKITTFLFFPGEQAEEAVNFYLTLFPDSKILDTQRVGDAGPGRKGSVLTISFQLAGQPYMALNGKPAGAKFNESVSLFVQCQDQAEVDALWEKILAGGGEEIACGWIRDKFGLPWQVVPSEIGKYLWGPDAAGRDRAMKAMMQMKKFDVAQMKTAYEGQ